MKTEGNPVQRLRSDNGGEFAGYRTIELLEELGQSGSRLHLTILVKMG
jgi:hypothetical protein